VLGMPEQISLEEFGRFMVGGSSSSISETGKATSSAAKSVSRTRMPSARDGASTNRGGQVDRQPHQEQQQQQSGWKTALLFLSTHLVGRQEARRARGVISR
jgi:hypothetical protein